MRKVAALLGIVAIVVLLLPVGRYALEGFRARWSHHQQERPARKLPIRPADYQKYPRAGFGFILEDGRGGRIDTFSEIAARPFGRDTTIALRLERVALDTIYQKVIEVRFFDLPSPHPPYPTGTVGAADPGVTMRLLVRAGGVEKALRWNTRHLALESRSDDWKRIAELRRLILRTVESTPEYRALLRHVVSA